MLNPAILDLARNNSVNTTKESRRFDIMRPIIGQQTKLNFLILHINASWRKALTLTVTMGRLYLSLPISHILNHSYRLGITSTLYNYQLILSLACQNLSRTCWLRHAFVTFLWGGRGNGPFVIDWNLSSDFMTRKTSKQLPSCTESDVFVWDSKDLVIKSTAPRILKPE